jgi:Flp pilus assembly protein TadB
MTTSTLQLLAAGLVALMVIALTLGSYVWLRRRALGLTGDMQAQLRQMVSPTGGGAASTVQDAPRQWRLMQRARAVARRLPTVVARRTHRVEHQLPDAIDLLVNAVRAGYSVPAAMEFVGREMASPVGPAFQRFHDEQRLGMDMRTALDGLRERLGTPDAQMLVLALQIQRETGGNLAEVLENLGHVVRERLDFRDQVAVLTAESRLSATVLSVLPVMLFFVIRMINPGYLGTMTQSTFGQGLMLYAVLSLMIGTIALRHLAHIEV